MNASTCPICPTCGLPAQADIVQIFRDMRTRITELESLLSKASAVGTGPRACPTQEPIHA